ncbi:tyrosine-type recombinase/integrase [Rhizobium sp. CC1099]|uniref:integrase family protein n=1 Tax=Rhizobium sp. CC1099 TaxID=3039160 RepID=UPI0024B05464|nr:tyrosine-type recombinase/integrase [Rhizobium sp. CC1099]WFU88738.1 tyrosine-type recombinase/integrase [Rhizobium sp. CC1099]
MPFLSEDFVRRIKLEGRDEALFRDTKLTGFVLRVRRRADGSLAKTFFISHLTRGADGKPKRRKIVIGDYATFPAEAAREEAQKMLQAVKIGDDPAAIRAAKKAQPLFEELVGDFRRDHINKKKPGTKKDYEGRIRRVLMPFFKGKRVVDITTSMVKEFHRKKRSNPTDANRGLAVLSAMMTYAIEEGIRPDNPCRGVKRNSEMARDQWLDEHDLPKFLTALATVEGAAGELIRFLAVSGWRVSEARLLRWDEVDLQRLVANLGDTKTGAQTRSLAADAAVLINRQPGRVGYVFTNRAGLYPVSYKLLREVLEDVCNSAEIQSITPHVLRHSAATWAAVGGAQAHELREAFGWKTLAMTSRYVSKSESLGRRGAERAANAINIFGKPAADVVAAIGKSHE